MPEESATPDLVDLVRRRTRWTLCAAAERLAEEGG
jgi:hypothetical protein